MAAGLAAVAAVAVAANAPNNSSGVNVRIVNVLCGMWVHPERATGNS
jgi:hypothetical protein